MKDFLQPILKGKRFDETSIPLEVLGDWVHFEELVVETARQIYLAEELRERVPSGFREAFDLHIVKIDEGSAKPLFGARESPYWPYFEKALGVVLAAMLSQSLDDERLPTNAVKYFNQFGRSLRPDESVTFSVLGNDPPVVYNREVRKSILIKHTGSYDDFGEVKGSVFSVNAASKTFEIKDPTGTSIVSEMPTEARGLVVKQLDAHPNGWVSVRGLVRYDQGMRATRIADAMVEALSPLDIDFQLTRLGQLENGWLEGSGNALNRARLDMMAPFLRNLPDDIPLPGLFPTEEGNVQIEWRSDARSVVCHVDLSTMKGEARFTALDGEDSDDEMSLISEPGWAKVFELARKVHAA